MKAKVFISWALCVALALSLCVTAEASEYVRSVVKQAETMTLEELAMKAIEESDGKAFYGVGNSSRCNTAWPLFEKYLRQFKPDYKIASFEWQQPKNNKIFDQLLADSMKKTGTFAMTLVQDSAQIEEKLIHRNVLETFIPKQWREDGCVFISGTNWLPLQLPMAKIFMFNNTGTKQWTNCWDFVYKDEHGLFVDIDSEPVGKNFLYMLTHEKYAAILAEAFHSLDSEKQDYFKPIIDSLADDAKDFGLGPNGKYALAWIKLWVENYYSQTDDAVTCAILATRSAWDQFGLLVYSKLRGVDETDNVSKAYISVAAYQNEKQAGSYKGIGGYSYGCYFFVTSNSPLPWTSCAFIAFMTCTTEGFSAWGRDRGGYASSPRIAAEIEAIYHHSTAGYVDGVNKFDCCNDRGYDWWMKNGNLVVEDPVWCSKVAFTVGSWIDMLNRK